MFSTRAGAARLTIITVAFLIVLKVAVGVASGSVSVIAQATDSLLDLFAALVTLFSLRFAQRPPDAEHPFGHGKAESISGLVQSGLIFAAAAFILYQAITRIISGAVIEYVTAGIAVMAVCIVVNVLLSRHLLRVARKEDSIALEANARNITTDIYTALGVLAGLVVVQVTGLAILDSIIAIAVAAVIVKTALDVIKRSLEQLMDVRLPPEEETVVQEIICAHYGEVVGFHALRTRKAGDQRYIDLHLVVARGTSVGESHRLCEKIEEEIQERLSNSNVTIHVEPCPLDCPHCVNPCPLAQDRRGR